MDVRRQRTFLAAVVPGFAIAVGVPGLPAASSEPADPADLILHDGKIVTMDGDGTVAESLAVRDGEIIAVGTEGEVSAHAGPRTEMIDLRERTVIPGLNDSHIHLDSAAENRLRVDISDAGSVAEVVEAIAEGVAETPDGEWVVAASGWHESLLEEGRLPTRYELDAVSPDNPVYIPRGGHVATVNSLALELADIDAETEDPDAGVIVRDADGEPTGVLFQNARQLVLPLLPEPPGDEELKQLLTEEMAYLNSYGITSLTVPGIGDREIGLLRELHDEGAMTVRAYANYRISDLEDVEHAVATYDQGEGDDMLTIGGFKYGLDGGVEGGYMSEPYEIVEGEQEDPEYRGVLRLPPGGLEEVEQAFLLAAEEGWQVNTHIVGDAAVDIAMDLYEAVDDQQPIGDLRWVAMHNFHPSADALRRQAELGVATTAQNHPVLLGRNMIRYWGEERAAYTTPIRQMLDAGLIVGGGTDYAVVPVDPFLSLWWMEARGTLTGEILGPEHGITRTEALETYTLGSAYTQFAEDRKGSLEVGKLADLVVLSDDILAVDTDDVRDIQAEMTMVGGEVVYERESERKKPETVPDVRGPIAETADSYMWSTMERARKPFDVVDHGFVEEEYFLSGTANVYDNADGDLTVVEEDVEYINNILVRRPADAAESSGVVLVDILNASNGFPGEDHWRRMWQWALHEGHTVIGMTSKPIQIDALHNFDPERYAELSWDIEEGVERDPIIADPNDPDAFDPFMVVEGAEEGLAWDILTQLGALLDSDRAGSVLGGQAPETVLLMGQSQSGIYLNTYATNFHKAQAAANDGSVWDGYLNSVGAVAERPLQQEAEGGLVTVPGSQPELDVPFITVTAEGDAGLFGLDVLAETDLPDNRRHWQVPGTPHTDLLSPVIPADEEIYQAGRLPNTDVHDPEFRDSLNLYPLEPTIIAAAEALVTWVEDDVPAAPSQWLKQADGELVRDESGNVMGGVRYGLIEYPLGEYLGAASPGAVYGSMDLISAEEFASAYGTRSDYLELLAEYDAAQIAAGYLTDYGAAYFRDVAETLLDRICVPAVDEDSPR